MRLRWLVEGNGFRDPKLERLLCKDVNRIIEASNFMVWDFFDQFSSCKQLSVFIHEGLFFRDLLYSLLFPVLLSIRLNSYKNLGKLFWECEQNLSFLFFWSLWFFSFHIWYFQNACSFLISVFVGLFFYSLAVFISRFKRRFRSLSIR